ncbi:pentatricopeptide repeat-containing protein At2g13420, mitochondrial-like [Impatiens glandulifera]|uniref:pentatricopeptide repeat-containing protein At2g13420, mitochondrial-like n=1 Tax=Impatiens glandulifera TaxID=253017 RepID=UPI001FB0A33D|nr:pentatricopeptide repeat-containing protein At2g13420, mitochondrial-like [Impatiens glandulifera]
MAFSIRNSHRMLSFILEQRPSLIALRLFCDHSSSQELEFVNEPLPLPSLQPSNDAEMVSLILLQHHNPFHTMESSLQLNGLTISPLLVQQVLIRLRNVSKVAFAFFSWAKSQANYRHDAIAYELMIDILGKVQQFDVAWQLIIEMDQQNVKPTSIVFRVLIRRLVSSGLTRQSISAFDDMKYFLEKEPNEDDFCYLLDTLCKYGHVKVATQVFNERKHQFSLDVKLYTVMIYGWCKLNRIQIANSFFKEMMDNGIEPSVVTYNVLLNGICRKSSLHPDNRFESTIRAADKLLDEMQARGIEPDVTSYSIVLHVYSRAHKPDLVLDKLEMMKDKGIWPTVATYTSVVKCLCSCDRLEDAVKLVEEMVSNGVSPSAATYNCFFKEYRGRKDVKNALKLYREIQGEKKCLLSSHTYNILVDMFVKLNEMKVVKELWDDMKSIGSGPDLDSYTLLIHALCKHQMWKEACQYFVEMIEKGFLPQKITFETLYKGLIQSNMLRTWRRLKKKLEEESMTFGSEYEQYHFKPYRR